MSLVRSRIDTGFASPLSRQVGAAFLAGSGLVNLALGVWLYGQLGSESAVLSLLSILDSTWAESQLLASGDTISVLIGTVAPTLVAVALVVGIGQCVIAALVASGGGYRLSIVASIAGTVTVVAIPLCLVALLLCWASRGQFDDSVGLSRVLGRSVGS